MGGYSVSPARGRIARPLVGMAGCRVVAALHPRRRAAGEIKARKAGGVRACPCHFPAWLLHAACFGCSPLELATTVACRTLARGSRFGFRAYILKSSQRACASARAMRRAPACGRSARKRAQTRARLIRARPQPRARLVRAPSAFGSPGACSSHTRGGRSFRRCAATHAGL